MTIKEKQIKAELDNKRRKFFRLLKRGESVVEIVKQIKELNTRL